MKLNYKTKRTLVSLGITLLVIAVVFVSVRLFNGTSKIEDYSKTRISWTVGSIDEFGVFDNECEFSMVSQAIEIGEGFMIKPEFTKNVTYEVHFYDEKDNYLYCYADTGNKQFTNILEYTVEDSDENVETVPTYFRVVLIPNDKDGEIKLLESLKYAGHIAVYARAD